MAGNEWINSYLDAILDEAITKDNNEVKAPPHRGGGGGDGAAFSLLLRERGHFSPSTYFIDQVVTGFDETDIHRSWLRAAATRSPQERNTRLENLCWRIWNLARIKKQNEGKEPQQKARLPLERRKSLKQVTADMLEVKEETGDKVGNMMFKSDPPRRRMPRISSVEMMETWAGNFKEKKLYIVLISLHGLIRGERLELGRDSDTGGQVKYVVELARALGSMPGVYRVELLTRQILAPGVDPSYSERCEKLRRADDSSEEVGKSGGAYIIRIPFGPKDKYFDKELLWAYFPEFVDGALAHIKKMSMDLGDEIGDGQHVWPTAIHGHYADAGDSAALLSASLNVPMVFTGHSLGRDKLEQLVKQGREDIDTIYRIADKTYRISRRIEAEELCLDASEMIITSTRQEIKDQWQLYDGFDCDLENKLRARMRRGLENLGRFMPRVYTIPPGMEFHHIAPHDGDNVNVEFDALKHDTTNPDPPIWSKIMRFFSNPHKPMILALARADPKKNLTTLVKAFGECRLLRELANLTLIMGNRDDIDEMSSTNASVMISILKLIDQYDLYGHVAYPKHHEQTEVPDIYRLAAKTKGVFINPALIEPFGLTLIEAAAYGLPIVATENGGPVDIIAALDNGILINPHDQQSIAEALLKLVADTELWKTCRNNGLKNVHLYSWPEHCKTYLSRIACCKPRQPNWQQTDEYSDTDSDADSLSDIKDISLSREFSMDVDKLTACVGTFDGTNRKLEDAIPKLSQPTDKRNDGSGSLKFPAIKRRKYVFVIALDSDKPSELLELIKNICSAAGDESVGFVLSTSMTILEVDSLLSSGGLKSRDFDAFICNSGSDLYYSSSASESPFVLDEAYHSHIDYHWGGEGLKNVLLKWAASINQKRGTSAAPIIWADETTSTAHCYSFKVNDFSLTPPAKEIRKEMREQALRCHILYCKNGSRLNVIPVLASRSQALRYLYLRWGTELSQTVVFIGESGDGDYEGMLGGLHKTVKLKGICTDARKLHKTRNHPLEHVVAPESPDNPNLFLAEGSTLKDIKAALTKLGVLTS